MHCTIPLCTFNNTFYSWFTSPIPHTTHCRKPTPPPTNPQSTLPHPDFFFILTILSILRSHPPIPPTTRPPPPTRPPPQNQTPLPTFFFKFYIYFNSMFTTTLTPSLTGTLQSFIYTYTLIPLTEPATPI